MTLLEAQKIARDNRSHTTGEYFQAADLLRLAKLDTLAEDCEDMALAQVQYN